MSPPRPSPAKLSDTFGLDSRLRTRAPSWLNITTDSPPSHRNHTGIGIGPLLGATTVIQTTISSRRCAATRAPNAVLSSTIISRPATGRARAAGRGRSPSRCPTRRG